MGLVRRSLQQACRRVGSRSFSSGGEVVAADAENSRGYSGVLCVWHWCMGAGILGTLGTVKVAQQLNGKDPMKGELMKVHKSLALVTAGMLIPRIALRILSPANSKLHSKLSHIV